METRILYGGLSKPKAKWKIMATLIRWSEVYHSFFKPSGWFNLYHSSHVFAIHPAHKSRNFYMVNHSAGAMVHWLSEPNFIKINEITALYKFILTEDVYRKIKNAVDLQCGDAYPMMENVGIAYCRFILWAFEKKVKNPFGKGSLGQKCSEQFLRQVILQIVDWETLKFGVQTERGYELWQDIDLIGIRDMYEVFEWLSSKGYCYKVPVTERMEV
jgi:hypothetical protein